MCFVPDADKGKFDKNGNSDIFDSRQCAPLLTEEVLTIQYRWIKISLNKIRLIKKDSMFKWSLFYIETISKKWQC